jgi:hypothetical protein
VHGKPNTDTTATAPRSRGTGTLRVALCGHPAGPELLAALRALADRPLPAGWTQWSATRWDRYLDAVLAEARAERASPSGAGTGETC